MNTQEKQEMAKIMFCKKNENETKRFWRNQERLLSIPLSEKQIMYAIGGFYMDT